MSEITAPATATPYLRSRATRQYSFTLKLLGQLLMLVGALYAGNELNLARSSFERQKLLPYGLQIFHDPSRAPAGVWLLLTFVTAMYIVVMRAGWGLDRRETWAWFVSLLVTCATAVRGIVLAFGPRGDHPVLQLIVGVVYLALGVWFTIGLAINARQFLGDTSWVNREGHDEPRLLWKAIFPLFAIAALISWQSFFGYKGLINSLFYSLGLCIMGAIAAFVVFAIWELLKWSVERLRSSA